MEWIRGEQLGRGSFATVNKAKPKTLQSSTTNPPPLMAVKSSEASFASLLKHEKQILNEIGPCPQILRCFGDDRTFENGVPFYNLFLEYAAAGSLSDHLKKNGGKLPESDVRRHARSVLKGLGFVHSKRFVHCDVKLANVLVFDNGEAKIADFGLAKKAENCLNGGEVRGTPMYMSPESVNEQEFESPADIWAFGCLVSEMVTGKPVWDQSKGSNLCKLLMRIGGEESPEIPEELSEEGRDFIAKCLVKDQKLRWTAEMLLEHPFVMSEEEEEEEEETVTLEHELVYESPRGPFDFPDWVSMISSEVSTQLSDLDRSPAAAGRLRRLVTEEETEEWSVSRSWVTVR